MKRCIAVIGSDGGIGRDIEAISESIGRDIAKSDCVLVCGGRGGVMEAASRGAKEAGGLVVGILPSLDKAEANRYVDVALTTGLSHGRNTLVASSADAVIVVNGRIGTLSELGLALCYGKPVIAVEDSGGVAGSIRDELARMGIECRVHAAKAGDAVSLALKLIK